LLVILFFELLFLKVPLENEYLLPMLPFLLILAGKVFGKRKILLYSLFFLILSYNFINFNFIKVDNENNATYGKIGLFIENGYLLNDIEKRINEKNKFNEIQK
jgi:hypothetical protein